MYSIANFFTWIVLLAGIAGIVVLSLMYTGVIANTTEYDQSGLIGGIIGLCVIVFFSFITIAMVRRAKADGSSKGWDALFLIFGIFGGNIFYFLGGLFGLIAPR